MLSIHKYILLCRLLITYSILLVQKKFFPILRVEVGSFQKLLFLDYST